MIKTKEIQQKANKDGGVNFSVRYTGPLGGIGANKSVKVDVSRAERMMFAPVLKPAIVNYSDLEPYQLLCYPLTEILVEKLRCVMQRMQPRDFYDIWFLLEEHALDAAFHHAEFCEKCTHKGLDPADFPKKLAERLPNYKARWTQSMSAQIQNLPDFEKVAREVQKHLKKMPF